MYFYCTGYFDRSSTNDKRTAVEAVSAGSEQLQVEQLEEPLIAAGVCEFQNHGLVSDADSALTLTSTVTSNFQSSDISESGRVSKCQLMLLAKNICDVGPWQSVSRDFSKCFICNFYGTETDINSEPN